MHGRQHGQWQNGCVDLISLSAISYFVLLSGGRSNGNFEVAYTDWLWTWVLLSQTSH